VRCSHACPQQRHTCIRHRCCLQAVRGFVTCFAFHIHIPSQPRITSHTLAQFHVDAEHSSKQLSPWVIPARHPSLLMRMGRSAPSSWPIIHFTSPGSLSLLKYTVGRLTVRPLRRFRHTWVCRMRCISCISLVFNVRMSRAGRSDGLVVCKMLHCTCRFDFCPTTVPSRSSAGQSLIATRAWLACRALLHKGGYHYATSCGGEGADGAPTFLHTGSALQPRALGRL
jgi:hypothetical protein